MKHIADITTYLEILLKSERIHVLAVMGAPGWAKTSTIRGVLADLGVKYQLLGAYATPLALFNTLHEVGTGDTDVLVLDDAAGVFNSQQALSLLNAASWPSVEAGGARRVRWTSTSEKASVDGFDFSKKLVVLTNYLPQSPQAKAFVSRSMLYEIELNHDLVTELLHQAARSSTHFPDSGLAGEVADFLSLQGRLMEPGQISLRNLEMGYEFATLHPAGWRDLLLKVLPSSRVTKSKSPAQVVLQLSEVGIKTEEQAALFSQMTGKSRRTFFTERKRLGLSSHSFGHQKSSKTVNARI